MPDIQRPTRGLKNRNPGNLRFNPAVKWKGLTGQDNKGFCVFNSDEAGIRAAVIDLHTDYVRDHQCSVLALIAEYAPPVENDTKNYAKFVADRLGVDPLATIPFTPHTAEELIRAIIKMENGIQPYPDAVIVEGVAAAFAQFAPKTIGAKA
ncbi:hypothetical protein [Paramagnetospirillum magneticum]|uniref:Structural protein P5 n=1 Tax=Paramagnetospirillum magneticum (strain ATCC 700264 / AMB-1) TaxID=342108 RepID=Q2WA56_PARM1|nr:hypothetical protein [Paramagnetospirillum magneticum]BAE49269.1 hypothetical protein amb0465 [Paramagnetospirillum magneticum AMB-1]